jgi:hypothetical protein
MIACIKKTGNFWALNVRTFFVPECKKDFRPGKKTNK